jgi:chemotaxis protein MotB
MKSIRWTLSLLLVGAVGAGCVTSSKYEAKENELKGALGREDELKARVARLEGELQRLRGSLDATTGERDTLRKQLDDAQALVGELKQRLEKLGQNVDKLASERGQLAAGLEDAQKRLEELRKQKAAAEARAATFRTLVDKLRSMIDAGQLKVAIRRGRMLIVLPNDVLFDSGRTDLKPAGKQAVGQVATVLAAMSDRRFQVAGHTDNVPIKTARFPSNWELSSARAIEVTRLLVAGGMRPEVLAAAGYAEFDPVEGNEAPEGRALNRRIEIILEPNLSDLPSLDNLNVAEKK